MIERVLLLLRRWNLRRLVARFEREAERARAAGGWAAVLVAPEAEAAALDMRERLSACERRMRALGMEAG